MAKVTFYPDNREVQVQAGVSILQAARLAGLVVESPCNGNGTCGKCRVRLDARSIPQVVQRENKHLSKRERSQGIVLACHTEIRGDIGVEIINKENKSLKILSYGKSFGIEPGIFIKKEFHSEENVTTVYAGDRLLGTEAGNTLDKNYGVVVDIGTTTLVASLVDINTGKEVDHVSSLNPQAVHAQDVLSRIKFASEERGLQEMYSLFVKEVNRMIWEVTERSGVNKAYIYEVVFSGNTCMLHLATNVTPYSLGKYPYTLQITGGNHLKAADHNLNVSGLGLIYLPPIISAYVGADITSGILATKLFQQKGVTLFVDIGTNGEMVLGVDGKLSATSTAAGPAFEGMNITCGMRAGEGAIEQFKIGEDGRIKLKTIGASEATGICGSGLLDITGELIVHGVICKNGKFVDPETRGLLPALRERLVKEDGKTIFKVTENVYLTQKDVRQVQLAKGAFRTGIEFLLRNKGIKASDVDRVLIAGSFGYHLRTRNLINIGLLPREFAGKIDFMGNTSKTGGQAFLLNRAYRQEMERVVKEVEVLELANYKEFDRVFISYLGF